MNYFITNRTLRGVWFVLLLACSGLLWLATEAKADPSDAVNLVDVLMLYTPQARISAGGNTVILAQIDQAIVEANTVFQNSRAKVRVRLAHADEVAYEESGSLATDLGRLSDPRDGFLDSAATLRNQYAGDLVCLIVGSGDDMAFKGLPGL